MSSELRPAWLVLGPLRLLDGSTPPQATDTVALVPLRAAEQENPTNTIIMAWLDLHPTTATAYTVDGNRLATASLDNATLFNHGRPSRALQLLAAQTASDRAASTSTWAPLFYVSATPAGGLLAIHIYSQVRFHPDDACFIRTTEAPLHVKHEDFSWLRDAIHLHRNSASFLNSHECQYRTYFPGRELEHKYTLPANTDIWDLTLDTLQDLSTGRLPGFHTKYRDELQRWDYLNHVFEITEPENEAGYVSLIPMTNGAYLVKRKWFSRDAFARREHHDFNVSITGSLQNYIETALKLLAHPLPAYRRIRYDVNAESLRTGHTYAVLHDRCTLIDAPDVALTQCEVEYNRSRTALPARSSAIFTEMNDLANAVERIHSEHHIESQRGVYSKLTFLRKHTPRLDDAAGDHAVGRRSG